MKTGALAQESVMLVDDIEADIGGARNAGIDQVFINHKKIVGPVEATYTVYSLKELKDIF